MAAAYAFHICKNHPFMDGNKRAGTAAMISFLSDNGWSFDATADEAEPVILQLAAGSLSKVPLTEWLQRHCHEKPRMELREFFVRVNYQQVAGILSAGLVDDDPGRAHAERIVTMQEVAQAIPAINQANLDALAAQIEGRHDVAARLHAQSHLLTALYRIAEDMGYEW